MKTLNTLVAKLCLISVFCMSIQFCLAVNTPIIIIKKDPIPPVPTQPNRIVSPTNHLVSPIFLEATISDTEMIINFDPSIGNATINVTDDTNQVVYVETLDTERSSEIHIPVVGWSSGNYNLTITNENTTLRGDFLVE